MRGLRGAMVVGCVGIWAGCGDAERTGSEVEFESEVASEVASEVEVEVEVESESESEVTAPTNTPGKDVRTLLVDGQTRDVIIYVPQKAAATKVPVVLMLHGTSHNGEDTFATSTWREKADDEGFIAVFPTALTYCFKEDENQDGDFDDPGEARITTKWTNGKLGEADGYPLCTPAELASFPPARQALANHPLVDDVPFIDALLVLLGRDFDIDPERIYVSGFSNGASFAGRLAVERSDKFAAAGCGSSTLAVTPTPTADPISVVLWVGNKDPHFVPTPSDPLPISDALIQVPAIRDHWVAPYLTALRLTDHYTYEDLTLGDEKAARFTFTESTAGAHNTFQFLALGGMLHRYPNGENYPARAANFLWDFFCTQTRTDP